MKFLMATKSFLWIAIGLFTTIGLAQEKLAISEQRVELVNKYRAASIEKWESEIAKFEALDRKEADPDHAILFIGSSSIRRWEKISEDMAPWPIIQRGFGGCHYSDVAVFIDRLIGTHKFDAVVFFVGNDIAGKATDKTPEAVGQLFEYIVSRVREKHPAQPIFVIAITPTESRFGVWEKIRQANAELEKVCNSQSNVHFIATESHYLNAEGKPIAEYFEKDKLHQTAAGYAVWSKIIKASLSKVLVQQ